MVGLRSITSTLDRVRICCVPMSRGTGEQYKYWLKSIVHRIVLIERSSISIFLNTDAIILMTYMYSEFNFWIGMQLFRLQVVGSGTTGCVAPPTVVEAYSSVDFVHVSLKCYSKFNSPNLFYSSRLQCHGIHFTSCDTRLLYILHFSFWKL